MRAKHRIKPSSCRQTLQLSWNGYQHMKKRIRIKLGRGLVHYRLWPLENYFNDNHQKKVNF